MGLFSAGWFDMAAGLVAVVAIAVAVACSARLRSLTRRFGIGPILGVHSTLGWVALGAVLLHILFVMIDKPSRVGLLIPWAGTEASRAAIGSTLALFLLIWLAGRKRDSYDRWRQTHLVLALSATVLAAAHVYLLHHLIDEPAVGVWFTAVAVVTAGVLIMRWVWRPLSSGAFAVADVQAESPSVSTVTLQPRQGKHRHGGPPVKFEPGQFGWLRFTRHPTTDHPFTFSSSAHDARQVQVTFRRGGEFTSNLTQSWPGRPVWVDGPHGGFTPPDSAVGLVMIAGGVGITPMMSILRTASDRRDARPYRLIMAADSPQELLFRAEIDQLRTVLNLSVAQIVSHRQPGWTGLTGRINPALMEQVMPGQPMRALLDYFICGPTPMVTDTVTALSLLGVPKERVHTELFLTPTSRGRSGAHHSHAAVRVGDSGRFRAVVHGWDRLGDTAPLRRVGQQPRRRPQPATQPTTTTAAGGAKPELHADRPQQPVDRVGAFHPVPASGDRSAAGAVSRGERQPVGVRGSDDPRPGDRATFGVPAAGDRPWHDPGDRAG